MIILAIDTSLGTSVALVGDVVLAEVSSNETRNHAELVGRFIDTVLAETGTSPSEVKAVVAGLGPGAFTGLRVGIAAATAFALARSIPLFGLSSHDAVALGRTECTVVTDVRRRELAWTSYRDGIVVGGPALTNEESLADDVDRGAFPEVRATAISAGALGLAARERRGRGDDLTSMRPLYLRAPDATPSKGPKRVTS